ncbi:MAG: hypothetical protein H0T42_16090, partial [Deltaproteobacteria bacterium]|nr:hypothetical protein [Deltaproteobacteria bacterium]
MSTGTFGLQLTRFRRTAQLAVARSGLEVAPEILDGTRAELEVVTAQLAGIRDDDSRPDLRLASVLGLTPDQLDFLWAVVARAADPMLGPILALLSGSDAKRGLSVSHYATIMGLDSARSQDLATILSPAHPLLRHRFLVGPHDAPIDACTPLTVPPRVWSYLRGDDDVEDQLAFAGGRVRVPHDAQFDAVQLTAIARLVQAFGSIDPLVIVVEGPLGAGRRTAIAKAAAAARRAVIAIDLGRIVATPRALEEALAAQMRECLLADAIPVIAEVDELIDAEGDRSQRLQTLARALETAPGAIAVTSAIRGIDLGVRGRRVLRVEWPVPSTDARRALWISALGDDAARLESGVDEIA